MDNRFETSFIPQQPLLRVEGLDRRQEYVNFALIVSLILFFVTLAVAGGLYFYERQLRNEISRQSNELQGLESVIGATSIEAYRTLDDRIALAKFLINEHRAFSAVLNFIENNVATDVTLVGLDHQIDTETKNINLTLRGAAPSYASVYRQEDRWKTTTDIVTKFEHESVKLNETSGIVEFRVKLTLDKNKILYKDNLPSPEDDISVFPTAVSGSDSTNAPTGTSTGSISPVPKKNN